MGQENQLLPAQVKNIRTQLGLSQEEFAYKLGVSFTSVNRWENGKAKPSKLAIVQLERMFRKVSSANNKAE